MCKLRHHQLHTEINAKKTKTGHTPNCLYIYICICFFRRLVQHFNECHIYIEVCGPYTEKVANWVAFQSLAVSCVLQKKQKKNNSEKSIGRRGKSLRRLCVEESVSLSEFTWVKIGLTILYDIRNIAALCSDRDERIAYIHTHMNTEEAAPNTHSSFAPRVSRLTQTQAHPNIHTHTPILHIYKYASINTYTHAIYRS